MNITNLIKQAQEEGKLIKYDYNKLINLRKIFQELKITNCILDPNERKKHLEDIKEAFYHLRNDEKKVITSDINGFKLKFDQLIFYKEGMPEELFFPFNNFLREAIKDYYEFTSEVKAVTKEETE